MTRWAPSHETRGAAFAAPLRSSSYPKNPRCQTTAGAGFKYILHGNSASLALTMNNEIVVSSILLFVIGINKVLSKILTAKTIHGKQIDKTPEFVFYLRHYVKRRMKPLDQFSCCHAP